MAELTFRQALGQAMAEEMEKDPDIFLMGEEVAKYDGAYKVTKGLLERFGPRRVWDSPISENGFAGLAVGAAMAGLKPVVEMMTWNFGIQAFDQIVNHAAKLRYMSGGQFAMNMVFRGPNGNAHMLAAQHSQFYEPMITNVPGMLVVSPSTPADGKGLLKAAIRENNPVIFLESEMMYAMKGEVPDEADYVIPLGQGDIKRPGEHVTLIAWSKVLHRVLQAAAELEKEGISAEVVDPRTLQPLDEELIFASVRKTHRAVVVEESWGFASVGAQISDRIQRECFDDLDAPVSRVCADFVHIPYNEAQEEAVFPDVEKIVQAAKGVLYMDGTR